MMTIFPFIAAVIAICSQVEPSSASSQSTLALRDELYKKIYKDDDPHIKDKAPKTNNSQPLQVHIRFRLSYIYEIAASKQMLDARFFIVMHWKNELMTWNETKYGMRSMYLNPEKMWKPTLFIPHSLSVVLPKFTEENSNMIVKCNGETRIDVAIRMQIGCKMTSCFFPNDKHKCNVLLMPSNHDENEVKFVADPTPFSAFVTEGNGLWRVKEGNATVFSEHFSKDPSKSFIVKELIFEQQPAYFNATVLSPVALIWVVILCALLLPTGSSDRMSLIVTCFLAQIVSLEVIFKLLPETSEYLPYVVTFVMAILVFTVLQLILSCLTGYFEQYPEKLHVAEALLQKLLLYSKKLLPTRKKIVNSPVVHVKQFDNNQDENNKQEGQNEIDGDTNKRMPAEQPITRKEDDVLVFRLIHMFSVLTIVWMIITASVVCILADLKMPSFLCNA